MKRLVFFLFFISSITAWAQPVADFGFETHTEGIPEGWYTFIDNDLTKMYLDSTTVHSGRYSAVIESTHRSCYGAWKVDLDREYEAQTIKLSGWIKGENIKGGYAGLRLRIEPRLGYEDLRKLRLNGTFDWQYIEVELPYPQEVRVTKIELAAFVWEKGKLWVDDLQLTLDGVPYTEAPLKSPVTIPEDVTFDMGSQVVMPTLTDNVLDNLELLGKVWGFLKYHHPAVTKAQYHWDYELFRFLPKYLAVTTTLQRDALLVEWIDGLGEVPACEVCGVAPGKLALEADHAWWQEGNLHLELRNTLQYLFDNRAQGQQYYVQQAEWGSMADFSNEAGYAQHAYPDAGFRLLALYRFWNMVHYYSPYRNITNTDWDLVLRQHIAPILAAQNELEYERTMMRLIAEINDSHAFIGSSFNQHTEDQGRNRPPFKAAFVENQLVVSRFFDSGYAKNHPLQVGDVITHIQGTPVADLVEKWEPLVPASNTDALLRDLSSLLLRTPQEELTLTYRRGTATQYVTIPTYINDSTLNARSAFLGAYDKFTVLEGNIGLINWSRLSEEDIPQLLEELKDTKAIIFDNREYPNGTFNYSLLVHFLSEYKPIMRSTIPSYTTPGTFEYYPTNRIRGVRKGYRGTIVALVGAETQSSAEYQTMVLQTNRKVTVMGSQTAGADGNVTKLILPGGLETYFSGVGIFYPDGTQTQRTGIQIDMEARPTIAGVQAGRDEVLERAIRFIENGE
ncbi:MAG TPA: peptidase S41 [Cytophagales bacterium]|nr:peptidase S41 [Cytophagales bacterium]HAA20037.1 peptidase S41 [Cytophagales bacterium]HAP60103.1 peptidase S41 [Cytophagales bacterium]